MYRVGPRSVHGGILCRIPRSPGAAPDRTAHPCPHRSGGRSSGRARLRGCRRKLLRYAGGEGGGCRGAGFRTRTEHQLLLPGREYRKDELRRGDHGRGGCAGGCRVRRSRRKEGAQGREGGRGEDGDRCGAAAYRCDTRRSRIRQVPQRDGDDALHQASRKARHIACRQHDTARIVHHEVECRRGDDAPFAGRIHQHTPLCARFAGGRVSGDDQGTRTRPGCHYRFRRVLVAARIGCVGRVCRSDDHPGLPPEPRPGPPS